MNEPLPILPIGTIYFATFKSYKHGIEQEHYRMAFKREVTTTEDFFNWVKQEQDLIHTKDCIVADCKFLKP